MTTSLTVAPISEYGIIVDPRDNVAVVKKETCGGLEIALREGSEVRVSAAVPRCHRFAARGFPAREFVLQYGQPIGPPWGIGAGDWIPHKNMPDAFPIIGALPQDLHTAAP